MFVHMNPRARALGFTQAVKIKGAGVINWHPQFRWWGIVAYESPVTAPRLLWHDPKEWMMGVFELLEGHPGLVANVRIIHGVDQDSPEVSRATAEGLNFAKNVVEPRLSAVRGDVQACPVQGRRADREEGRAGISMEEIEAACATPPESEDDSY